MKVVIDAIILVRAAECLAVKYLDVLSLMHVHDHCLALDHAGCIEGQYRRNVGGSRFFQLWFKEMSKKCLLYWRDGKLSRRIVKELTSRCLHEPTDQVLIAVALGAGRYIVTEDSDFGKGTSEKAQGHLEALTYMTHDLQLTIDDADEACQRLCGSQ